MIQLSRQKEDEPNGPSSFQYKRLSFTCRVTRRRTRSAQEQIVHEVNQVGQVGIARRISVCIGCCDTCRIGAAVEQPLNHIDQVGKIYCAKRVIIDVAGIADTAVLGAGVGRTGSAVTLICSARQCTVGGRQLVALTVWIAAGADRLAHRTEETE